MTNKHKVYDINETMHVLCMDWMNLEQGNVMCELSMGCQDGVCTRSAGNQTKGSGNQRGEYACVCGAVSVCVRACCTQRGYLLECKNENE